LRATKRTTVVVGLGSGLMAHPHMAQELAQLNPIALQELGSRPADGPVVMLNLLDFKPGGVERYREYAEAVAPLIERVGARLVYAGNALSPVIGPTKWDSVLLVEYPTRQAFLDMIGSPEYAAIAHLRTEAVERSELHPLDPVDPAQQLAG
jgi:uncharacterized protein (DUF1330 family)